MITKKTEYAIRALVELAAKPDVRLTANVIAQRQGIPPKYLPQIVAELSQAGLLRSVRGYGGGITLRQPPEKISLLRIVEAIQGKPKLFECQLETIHCAGNPGCGLQQIYDKALTALQDVFQKTALSDIKIKHRARGRRD